MIQPHEIRIGNYVSIGGVITTVNHIMGDEDEYEGVIISISFLKKFGFLQTFDEKNRVQYELPIDGFDSSFPIWMYRGEWCISPMGYNTGFIGIKYLHQLQNIYFALTQTELTITL